MKIKFNYSNSIFLLISLSSLFAIIYNIFYYNPILGYDAEAHFNYVNYLSRYLPNDFKLPSSEETREFFNPPLGYLVPSIAQVFCRNVIESANYLNDCQPIYGIATQIFQSIMYLFTILINLYTLKMFHKSESIFNVSYLILVSIFAVNYRTISMIRGEPYLLFFLSLLLFVILKAEINNYELNYRLILFTGVIISCIALSRQWGFFLFLPLIILILYKNSKIKYFVYWFYCGTIGFLLSGWFYLGLYKKYGSVTAFNMKQSSFSFSNQVLSFYIPNQSQIKYLFQKPIRPNLDNQFFSILYSDLWGDYWGYFTFTSRFLEIGRNQDNIGNYLARVNIISIFTTLILIIFCYLAYKKYKSEFLVRYVNFAILISFIGYLLFSIAYPNSSGDTIKSTYIIQAFHLVAFLASIYFYDLEKINKRVYNSILTLLVIIYFHNFQTFLSHFPINFLN